MIFLPHTMNYSCKGNTSTASRVIDFIIVLCVTLGKTAPYGVDLVSRHRSELDEGPRHLLRATSVNQLLLSTLSPSLPPFPFIFPSLLPFMLGDQCLQRAHSALQWQILATAASATRSILKTEKAKRELGSQGCGERKVSDKNGGDLYYLFFAGEPFFLR